MPMSALSGGKQFGHVLIGLKILLYVFSFGTKYSVTSLEYVTVYASSLLGEMRYACNIFLSTACQR